MIHISIVEDEPDIGEVVSLYLRRAGYTVSTFADGLAAEDAFSRQLPDLVILDVMLPGMDGFALTRSLRDRSDVPIILLTSRREEVDRIAGLELGADDYVVKPFSPREVVSRLRAILRRTGGASPGTSVPPGLFAVDERKRTVTYCGETLRLPRYEFDILRLFISRPGWVFSREQIMDLVWTEPEESFERTVDAHIKSIRGKLKSVRADLDPIVTHRGIGYSLREDLCP